MALVDTYLQELAEKIAGDAVKISGHAQTVGGELDTGNIIDTASASFSPGAGDGTAELLSTVSLEVPDTEAHGIKFLVVKKTDDTIIDVKELVNEVKPSGDEVMKIINITSWVIANASTDA